MAKAKFTPPESALRVAFSPDIVDPAPLDPVRAELGAMETIGAAMTPLSGEARTRVLRWAAELFAHTPATPDVSVSAAGAAGADLAVSDLIDFFDTKPAGRNDLNDLFDPAEGCALGDADTEKEKAPAKLKENEPVVSMIHGFVEDFKKLARDWESA
jgi:hypothetical protein